MDSAGFKSFLNKVKWNECENIRNKLEQAQQKDA